jgi:hypothetical protein
MLLSARTQLAILVCFANIAVLGLSIGVNGQTRALDVQLKSQGLDRFAMVRAVNDGKWYELPPSFDRHDPARYLVQAASLEAIAALPYIEQIGGLRSRKMGLRSVQGLREPAMVMMTTPSLLTALDLSGNEDLTQALNEGKAVIDPVFAQRLGFRTGDVAHVIAHTAEEIAVMQRGMPAELAGTFRFENDDFDVDLAVLPLHLPAGFHGFESAVLIPPEVNARHNIGGPLLMVKFSPDAAMPESFIAFERFLSTQAKAVAIGQPLEAVSLGSLVGGDDALNALHAWERRLQAWILGAALALCAGFLFLNWPVLLRELALRRTTGATSLQAIWRTAGPLLKVVAVVVVGSTLLAAGIAALQGGTLGTPVLLLMTGMALVPSILLLGCVGLAARRPLAELLGAGV